MFPRYKVAGGRLPPGPGRRYDRRHFARMESSGAILMWGLVLIALLWLAIDLGLLPDMFGWHEPLE